jgi:hypothetical protein
MWLLGRGLHPAPAPRRTRTISLVEDDADRDGILEELQRLDPAPEG